MQSYYSRKLFWKVIYIIWPPFLRLIEFLKIHNSRQKFLLGHLAPGFDKEKFKKILLEKDFNLDTIAYNDPGQILGMRKLESPLYQYHVRLFIDGEIRGHYEYTPEAKPVKHSLETGIENRASYFKNILKEFIIQ